MVMEANVAGGTVAAQPEKREKTRMKRSAQYEWQRQLWRVLAECNFCWHSVIEVFQRDAEWKAGKAERELAATKAAEALALAIANETPAQRKARSAREEKEAEANARYWSRQDRDDEAKANRIDHDAFHAGKKAADRIGLDTQVGSASRKEMK